MKDYFGKEYDLSAKKMFLFDMDGTIYRENNLYDGIIELLQKIKDNGGRYAFITNNPAKSLKDYMKKLKKMGINGLTEDVFFSSAQAAIMLLKDKFHNKLVYAQGTKSFIKELRDNGVNVTQKYSEAIDVVLVAFDPEITGKKLRTTCEVLCKLKDVPYYATNPDWMCPVEFGGIPDCGSMCFGVKHASGREPIFIGKPEPTMVLTLLKKFDISKEDAVVVGDRLYTDIASGVRAGVETVCVLTGEATIEDVENSEIKPTYLLNAAVDMLK